MTSFFHRPSAAAILASALVLTGCPTEYPNDSATVTDAGPRVDSGMRDGGMVMLDSGPRDSGTLTDSALPLTDAGLSDPTSIQIYQVRHAVMGAVFDLPIENATVTYIKPETGAEDPAGFFLQGERTGPGIFIQIDPASLTPPAEVGQVVDLRVNRISVVRGVLRVDLVNAASWTVDSSGADVTALSQNLDAITDLPGAVAEYESEIVTGTLTLVEDPAVSGPGHAQAQSDLAMISAQPNLRIRFPSALDLHLIAGCEVSVNNVPVWRFEGTAQITPFLASGVTVDSCPPPVLLTAMAPMDNTHVTLTFAGEIDPGTFMADGSQFTIVRDSVTPTPLMVTAAVLAGNTVTLTTVPQGSAQAYIVTVADTLTDFHGGGIPLGMNTAPFTGFVTPAVVVINELNSNLQYGDTMQRCDLLELRVVEGGTMEGMEILSRTDRLRLMISGGTVPSVPSGLVVATNDIIVVHLDGADPICRGNATTEVITETTSITQQPSATFTANYDVAWDFYTNLDDLPATDTVITLRSADGTILDVLFASDSPTGMAAGGTETAAEDARAAIPAQWLRTDGLAADPNYYVDGFFNANAVLDLNATGSTLVGDSLQRNTNTDSNNVVDWTQTAQTFGAINVGQTPF